MAPSSTEILGTSHKAIGPEELAIIGLMEAIFNLADNGSAFVRRLQTSFKVAGVFKDLSQLRPAEVQVSWLVGFIRENVKKEAIRSADAERRRSVSTIVEVCTFQLKHLTSRIFVGEKTSLSHSTSLLSILGKTREIRNRVNFLSVQTQDLTQLLEYLNKVRPSPSRPMSVPNPPISMIPRVACNDFVGREDTLKSLLTQLPQARQVILGGISGIGKSEICLQFARELRRELPQQWIFWIDGRNHQKSLIDIAHYLRISDVKQGLLQSFEQWLRTKNAEWVVVIDGIELKPAMASGVDNLSSMLCAETISVPDRNETMIRGNVLISSGGLKQYSAAPPSTHRMPTVSTIEVHPLKKDEAIKLIQLLLPVESFQKDAEVSQLISLTKYNPRSIKEAAAYIKIEGLTIQQYVTSYKGEIKQQRLLTFEDTKVAHPSQDSKDDVHSAASKIARRFLEEETLQNLLTIAKSKTPRTDIIKALERPVQNYGHLLKGLQKNTANELPAFIMEHYKRIATIVLELNTSPDVDFVPPGSDSSYVSSTVSLSKSLSRRSSFAQKMLGPRTISSRSVTSSDQHFDISTPSFDEHVRKSTIQDSRKLERLFFDSQVFGRFIIDFIKALGPMSDSSQIDSISKIALRACEHALGSSTTVKYSVTWELPKVLDSTFQQGQDLSEVAAINGEADDAEVVTCRDYIDSRWKQGACFLNLLNSTAWGHQKSRQVLANGAEISLEPVIHTESEILDSRSHRNHSQTVTITVRGPRNFQADVTATLAWLAAAIRHSESLELKESRASVSFTLEDDTPSCFIKTLPLSSIARYRKEGTCWHALFVHSTVAAGYPLMHKRQSVRGLEISYDHMIGLSKSLVVTERDSGFILQGLKFTLIPVEILDYKHEEKGPQKAVQWHLEPALSGVGSASSPSTPRTQLSPLKCKSLEQFDTFRSCKAFLGWCNKIGINVGTAYHARYSSNEMDSGGNLVLRYPNPKGPEITSNAKDAGRSISVSAATATLGGAGNGASGAAGIALAFGERRSAAAVNGPQDLEDNLFSKSASHIVLYDTDTRRAWMLPYLSVLLHLIHLRERATRSGAHPTMEMPLAAQWDDKIDDPYIASQAAWNAISPYFTPDQDEEAESSGDLKVLSAAEKLHDKTAKRLLKHLEYLVVVLREATNASVEWRKKEMALFHRSKVYGFELKEIAYNDNLLYKERKLRYTSGGWAKLKRNDMGVLFCSKLWEAIVPIGDDDELPEHWQTLPRDLDYLAAPLSCLKDSAHAKPLHTEDSQDGLEEESRETRFRIRVGNRGHQWDVTSRHFACHCADKNKDCCDHTTRISRRWRSDRESSLIDDFKDHMEGAVIFGRPKRASRVSKAIKACKVRPKSIGSGLISWIKSTIFLPQDGKAGSSDHPVSPNGHVILVDRPSSLAQIEIPSSRSSSISNKEVHPVPILVHLPPPAVPAVPIQPEFGERDPAFLSLLLQESTVGSSIGPSRTLLSQAQTEDGFTPSSSYSETSVLRRQSGEIKGDLKGIGELWTADGGSRESADSAVGLDRPESSG